MPKPFKLVFSVLLAAFLLSACGNKPLELTLPEESNTNVTNAN